MSSRHPPRIHKALSLDPPTDLFRLDGLGMRDHDGVRGEVAARAHASNRTTEPHVSATASLFLFATTWQPAETMLCTRHPAWIGPEGGSRHGRQFDVVDLTDIVRAQQPHRKLARHADRPAAADTFAGAARITESWARCGLYRERRMLLVIGGHLFQRDPKFHGGIPIADRHGPVFRCPRDLAESALRALRAESL